MSKPSNSRSPEPRSAVAEPIQQLVAFFTDHLPEVRFPGVDAASLEAHADELQRRADALHEAEAVLIAAREAHALAHAELTRIAQSALGYARVYAADDPRSSAALSEIELSPPSTARAPKAKRKAKPAARNERVTKLPFAGAAEPESVSAAS